jgi:hypothetical protein
MTDIAHTFGQDLAFGPTGDLLIADVPDVTTQRVLRRLLTNQGDYLWQLQYGAGLPSLVGQPARVNEIHGLIRGQMLQEAGVAQNPAPTVTVSSSPNGTVFANVTYADADTGSTQVVRVGSHSSFAITGGYGGSGQGSGVYSSGGASSSSGAGDSTGGVSSTGSQSFTLDASRLDGGDLLG